MLRWALTTPAVWGVVLVSLVGCGRGKGAGERASQSAAQPREQARVVEPAFTAVSEAMLAGAAVADSNWLVHGGTYGNQRYSALAQVTRDNVSRLVPVWVYQTGIAESFVTTPLVVDGAMYLTTPESHVVALNAATGKKLWEYVPPLGTTMLCCGPESQGVAVYGDKVYVGTIDARVVALDYRTGRVAWDVSLADSQEGYSLTAAPLAAGGKVIVGVGGAEYGTRGFVAALDAASGKEVWRWYTVVPPGDGKTAGWFGEWKQTDPFGTPLNRDVANEQKLAERYFEGWKRGGGAVRTTPAYDPASRTLFVSVGGPAPSLDGVVRPGDNLYAGSVVALDATNGGVRWVFQYLPHDVWDLSGGSPPFLYEVGGKRYVGIAGKAGWVYVIDAANGKPVLRSDNFVPQENLFARPTEEGIRMLPGANGGNSGAPVAYSPLTSLLYVPALNQPMVYSRAYQPWEKGRLWTGGSFRYVPNEPQWGVLSAIDLKSGEIRWQRQVPAPMSGGALVTAGGLLFVGQGTGTLDAFDAQTGALLWQFPTGAGVSGSPITYQVGGVQYLAVASGGHYQLNTPRGDAVIVFALFDNRPPPVLTPYPEPRYPKAGATRYGAARQVPAAEVERQRAAPQTPPPSAPPRR